jgi:hypothetical protein
MEEFHFKQVVLCTEQDVLCIFYCDGGTLQTSGNGGYQSIVVGNRWKLCIRCRFISQLLPYFVNAAVFAAEACGL